MTFDILTISTDGIPEGAMRVLSFVAKSFGATFNFSNVPLAVSKNQSPLCKLPDEVVTRAQAAHAVLFLSSDEIDRSLRINSARILSELGKSLNLYARVKSVHSETCECTLVCDTFGGQREGESGFRTSPVYGREAYATECYSELEIERVARIAYELSKSRRLALADMAHKLATHSLWRKIVVDINEDYPYVNVEMLNAEETAKRLVIDPNGFDVILSPYTIGESLCGILSAHGERNAVSTLSYLGETTLGVYSANRGTGGTSDGSKDNTFMLATLRACADMMEYSFGLPEAAKHLKNALSQMISRPLCGIQQNSLADEIISIIHNSLAQE